MHYVSDMRKVSGGSVYEKVSSTTNNKRNRISMELIALRVGYFLCERIGHPVFSGRIWDNWNWKQDQRKSILTFHYTECVIFKQTN